MIAVPSRHLWTPWGNVRPGCGRPGPRRTANLREKRSWLRRLIDPLAVFAAGDPVTDSSGNPLLDSSGNPIVDGGSLGCCLYKARKCSDNTLAGIYVKRSQFPSWPSTYYFSYSGTCYYVQSSDVAACSNTPISGQTNATSCACGCIKLTECSGGAGVVYTTAPLTPGQVYLYLGVCYLASTSTTCISPVSGPFSVFSNCANCEASGTTCQTCANLPSSLLVGGVNNTITNCAGSPFTTSSCNHSPPYSPWDQVLNAFLIGGICAYGDDFQGAGGATITLADGSCMILNSVNLGCDASFAQLGGAGGWRIQITWGATGGLGGCGTGTTNYYKAGTATPIGTYNYGTDSSPCSCGGGPPTWPASITVT